MVLTLHEFKSVTNCKIGNEEVKFLGKTLGAKDFVLLYRGSRDGWGYLDFHSRCDYKGSTVSLFQIKDGDCIGGYTEAEWNSSYSHKEDSNAMLFNLN